ncbi:GNAT family N-acetyltransferase [Alkalihalobacterium bogoriense]|uniref:GNAT family N-acetyltransferase n=1 Tax=Alkalihalobacterium bogoriense TaxID=246272 RepID=UPI00047D9FE7|nr:GNAT family N-acetyltransferase [Alkalihalobacterium bogoriense]
MFEVVRTNRQQKKFAKVWEYMCSKKGWINDPYAEQGIRYNLLTPSKIPLLPNKVVGTIEFIPFDPKNPHSTVEGPSRAKFSLYDDIRKYQSRTWEIDKLCIHKSFQRQGLFQEIMEIIYDHAKIYAPKYYVALIDKKLARMLKILYGLAIEQRGEVFESDDSVLVPIVFDIERIMNDKMLLYYYQKKCLSYEKAE